MPFSWDICSVWSLSLDISFWWQQIQQIGKRRQEKRWAEIELARERDVARQSPTKISRHCSTHRCSFACPKCKFSLCLWHFRPRPATGLHVYNIFQYIYLRERERARARASEGRRERGKEGGEGGPKTIFPTLPWAPPQPGLLGRPWLLETALRSASDSMLTAELSTFALSMESSMACLWAMPCKLALNKQFANISQIDDFFHARISCKLGGTYISID